MASEQQQDDIDVFVNGAMGRIGSSVNNELRCLGDNLKHLRQELLHERTQRKELEKQLEEMKLTYNKLCNFVQQESTALNEKNRKLSEWEKNLEEREKAVIFYEDVLRNARANLPINHPSYYHDKQHKQQEQHSEEHHHTCHTQINVQQQNDSLTLSMDPTHQQPTQSVVRRRSSSVERYNLKRNSKVYGEIRPGSITHEDIQRQFTEYFTKYRRRYGSTLVMYNKQKGTIPCQILQIAYDESEDKVLSIVKETLKAQQTKDAKKAKRMLVKFSISTSIISEERELHLLFGKPIKEMCVESGSPRNWEDTKYAFTLLLNSSDIKTDVVTSEIKDTMLTKHIRGVKNDELLEMLDKAIEIAWNMVTLVPPAIVHQPLEYHEEWQERRYTCWNEENGRNSLINFRPVLFFSTLGHVGCKGEIGNILPQSTTNDKHCTISIGSNTSVKAQAPQVKPSIVPRNIMSPKGKVPQNPCINDGLATSYGLQ